MAWFWRFAVFSFAAIVAAAGAVAGAFWWLGEFRPEDLGLHGILALGLGIAMSAVIGVCLMALVFFSARRGRDDIAGDVGRSGPAP